MEKLIERFKNQLGIELPSQAELCAEECKKVSLSFAEFYFKFLLKNHWAIDGASLPDERIWNKFIEEEYK
jgi:hypothetical protein